MRCKRVIILMVVPILLSALIVGCSSSSLPESQKPLGLVKTNMRSVSIYMRNQEFDIALERLLEVIEEMPLYIEALKKTADIYFHYGESEPAKADEYYVLSYNYYEKALMAFEDIKDTGEYPAIEEMVKDAELKLRASWVRLYNRSLKLFEEGDNENALKGYYKLTEVAPDSIKTYIMIATIYQKEDKDEKAAEYFQKIADKDSKDTVSRDNLARYYFETKDYDKALIYYENLVQLDPHNTGYYLGLGDVYIAKNEHNKAFEQYEAAYDLDKENVELLIYLGNLAFNQPNDEKAIKYYREALTITPDNKEIYFPLLDVLNRVEDYENMLDYAIKWHELDETSENAVAFILRAASKTNNTEIFNKYNEILKKMSKE